MFFEHQRAAFTDILTQIDRIQVSWMREGWDVDSRSLVMPVPPLLYEELKRLCAVHQLFLSVDSTMALDLLQSIYEDSRGEPDEDGTWIGERCDEAYANARYVEHRVVGLLQGQLGVRDAATCAREIALLGGMRIVNMFGYSGTGIADRGALQVQAIAAPAAVVDVANRHRALLVEKLTAFRKSEEMGWRYGALAVEVGVYLDVLKREGPQGR
ncbi:hypothetical protein LJR039_007370 [Pseudorhodoferax sp. LjRoot39]|uniref:hypothetical protein n=1 Tax=Pseudorhodoferax sp. LjRoot39 TaxID=3342328 RepID=UPI003ECE942A